jgi:hypothetical protein
MNRAHNLFPMSSRQAPQVLKVQRPRPSNKWDKIKPVLPATISDCCTKYGVPENIHLITSRNIRLCTETKLSNILAAKRVTQITELHGLGLLCCIIRVCGRVHGELLIVT